MIIGGCYCHRLVFATFLCTTFNCVGKIFARTEVNCKIKETVKGTKFCEFPFGVDITEPGAIFTTPRNEDVQGLKFSEKMFVHYLPEDIAASFPNLKTITANQCSLESLSSRNFRGLRKLHALSVSFNHIRILDEDTFNDLENLEDLNLIFNKISSLPPKIFAKLTKLRELELEKNQLTHLDAKIFENNRMLEKLDITDNHLQSLEPGIFDSLIYLEFLWLFGNEISKLPPNIFDHCTRLEVLFLSENKITDIPPNLLRNLTKLEEISFSGNPLKIVDFAIFGNNKNLSLIKVENLGDIEIRNIEKVDQLKRLKLVDFEKNSCIDKIYQKASIGELKNDVKANCTKKTS